MVFSAVALASPVAAYAQEIPPAIAVLAVSPILVFCLAIGLGVVRRSLIVAAAHAVLVAIWVMLFAIASFWVENDFVVWTPIALLGIHAVILIVLIAKGAKRTATNRDT